ncbi:adenosylcobinamide-phosphate synthase CbiB [Roseivivax sp. GX 12232]|uniref:adenosylcobinamide-phosphate synthase CbiB n=1 Tax=Roseivivax sp. GX 12232 TaxID=2900547 RepID=UPI001E5530BC|nr:adenosylcobinamide-phosphate synthase CbiB [Roseivivax sp. GX 12232]MCE0504784.1 adenosylcobinamide-phosphate synthase CbiB [Roseivivax sp. GX 12232]
MSFAAMMLVALVIDASLGWPAWLFARIGHPVTWIGALIARLDAGLNREGESPARRRARGHMAVALVLLAVLLPALALQLLLPEGPLGWLLGGVLAWPLLALRSMHDHVAAVARPLVAGETEAARAAVAMIVGRDPAQLDPPGIARAGLESLAENTSDGIVAPLFWGLIAGLPGIAAYKAVNTLDSMIGHRTPRHEDFGRAAARLDDLVNLPASRLTGGLFALVSARPRAAFAVMLRDAPGHRSPNAGWPEGAMAGALGVRLSGPRVYATRVAEEPWINPGAPDPAPRDLARGLALYARAMLCMAGALALLALPAFLAAG